MDSHKVHMCVRSGILHVAIAQLSLDRYLPSHAPPKITPLLQLSRPHIREPISSDHKLLTCPLELRHAWLRTIREFVSVRVAGLKERGESAGVA